MATSAEIYEILREQLVSGRYEPMHVFDVRQLSEEHVTSVVPVREAMLRLSERGLLRWERKRGFFVEKISGSTALFYLDQLREAYLYGIKRHKETDADLTMLETAIEAVSDVPEYLQVQRHIANIIFSDHEREHVRSMWDRIWIYRNSYLGDINTKAYLLSALSEAVDLLASRRHDCCAQLARHMFQHVMEKFPAILAKTNA